MIGPGRQARPVVIAWSRHAAGFVAGFGFDDVGSVPVPEWGEGDDWCGMDQAPDGVAPYFTIDALLDGLGFDGFRATPMSVELASRLADRVEYQFGPVILEVRMTPDGEDIRAQLSADHRCLVRPVRLYDRTSSTEIMAGAVARRMVEVCLTRSWTPEVRDMAMMLAFELADNAGENLLVPAPAVARWLRFGGSSPFARSSRAGQRLRDPHGGGRG